MIDQYELKVMAEHADVLVMEVVNLVKKFDFNELDDRVKTAFTASALVTAMQILDGQRMPEETGIMHVNGITERAAYILSQKGQSK
jgi:hypothetical protein